MNKIILIAVAFAITGCSAIENNVKRESKVDYKSAQNRPSLEIPPDLGTVTRRGDLVVPSARNTARSQTVRTSPLATADIVLPATDNARIERAGQQTWLIVSGDAAQLWPKVRGFFEDQGLNLVIENPKTGVMETDWLQNNADVGTGLQRLLRKHLGSLYSTGTRDKYRVRMERGNEPNTTEIFLSHRGMVETAKEVQTTDDLVTVWEPRPADQQLEAEMLRLLMVHIGFDEGEAQSLIANASQSARAELVQNKSVLQVNDHISKGWQRVGLALDRVGFTVENRDKANSTYVVRYVEPNTGKKKSFVKRLFKRGSKEPEEYRIKLHETGPITLVTIQNKDGSDNTGTTRDQLLALLFEQLQ